MVVCACHVCPACLLADDHQQGPCQYVVVLAEPSFSTNHFFDGLKRLAIVPPELAAVVGVTVLSASEANKVAKRTGLAPHTTVLSDEGRHWLRAHKIGDRWGPRRRRGSGCSVCSSDRPMVDASSSSWLGLWSEPCSCWTPASAPSWPSSGTHHRGPSMSY